jgi:hypothetical protein
VTKSCVLQKECPSLCNPNPCFHGTVQCTDVNRAHFTCGSCPAGYEGDGMVRTDVDECKRIPTTCHPLTKCLIKQNWQLRVYSMPPWILGKLASRTRLGGCKREAAILQ